MNLVCGKSTVFRQTFVNLQVLNKLRLNKMVSLMIVGIFEYGYVCVALLQNMGIFPWVFSKTTVATAAVFVNIEM